MNETVQAIQELVNTKQHLELNLEDPETQLQEVINLLEVGTVLTAKIGILYQGAKSARENNDAHVRRSIISNNTGSKLTLDAIKDALECDPSHQRLSQEELINKIAADNIKTFMNLYDDYRETLFRLVTLKSATTRNVR